jgi:hypothetical protein
MAGRTLSGSEELMKKLEEIAKRMGGGEVAVGFMEGATYPDGTPVAAVAFWNEFGKGVQSEEGNYFQMPRPFFRNMIAGPPPYNDTLSPFKLTLFTLPISSRVNLLILFPLFLLINVAPV